MSRTNPDPAATAFAHFSDLLASRHSCRAFLPRPVPQPTIRQLLDAAQRTASWCNAQPWRIVVTSGAATEAFRRMYAQAATSEPAQSDFPFPQEYRGEHLRRRRECGWQLYASVGVERGDREGARAQVLQNYELFGAPHVAIVTAEAHLGAYAAVDCGGWVANFMNAAASLGVASIAQAALASHPQAIRRHFGLSEEQRVVCGVSFGYADPAHPANGFRTRRAALDEVVSFRS